MDRHTRERLQQFVNAANKTALHRTGNASWTSSFTFIG